VHTFVASKVPHHMAIQKKRDIAAAVSKVLSGVTDMLGIFIHEISAVQDPATSNLRRSKRRRTVP